MSDELEKLRSRLKVKEDNLFLIEERKAGFILSADVPLQLLKEERILRDEIKALKQRIAELEGGQPPPAAPQQAQPQPPPAAPQQAQPQPAPAVDPPAKPVPTPYALVLSAILAAFGGVLADRLFDLVFPSVTQAYLVLIVVFLLVFIVLSVLLAQGVFGSWVTPRNMLIAGGIVLLAIPLVLVIPTPPVPPPNPPNATPSPTSTLVFRIRVLDKVTGEPVPGVVVIIETNPPGTVLGSAQTGEDDGIADVAISDSTLRGQLVTVIVEANGYAPYQQGVRLVNELIEVDIEPLE